MDRLKIVLKLISTNINWIKDVFWIIFTLVATVISIKTYKKAKETLLQPLRTEVVKRQTDLLVDLLDFIIDKRGLFFTKLDYIGIISLNHVLLMEDFGFIVSNDKAYDEARKHSYAKIILKPEGMLKDVELPTLLEKKENDHEERIEQNIETSKQKYKSACEGMVEFDYLDLTKCHIDTMDIIKSFASNPFMPSSIQNELNQLINEVSFNLNHILVLELENFIIELAKSSHKGKVNFLAIYNQFQRKAVHHEEVIFNIQKLTREYLMVDKKWHE